MQIPESISRGNHKALLFLEEETSEDWKDFHEFFADLNKEERKELLHFIEFLYQKKMEKETMPLDLRKELLERKKQALEEMERGELIGAEDVFTEIEATLGK